jgi:hypothetical protein
MLKRLARSSVLLRVDGGTPAREAPISLTEIGLRVSRLIEERFEGDRPRAEQACAAQAARALGIRDLRSWSAEERTAFRRLSPLVVLIPDLSAWTAEERRGLVRILRAKGSRQEASYARLIGRHVRLRRALEALSRPVRRAPFSGRRRSRRAGSRA